MMYKLTVKKTHRIVCECKYVGDIFIEIEERFNDDGYALELQAWCENENIPWFQMAIFG